MNKSLIIAAISAVAATGAFAQSSVTVYGRLNTSLEEQKNIAVNGTQSVMQNNGSRLGFKGTEDLGGGLKAMFLLEHRFDSDTGTQSGSAFWAGDAYVGLSGGFGTVRLGRLFSAAYYATTDYISMHNHDTGTSSDALYTYLSGSGSNTISYMTPSMGGATLEISQSAAEGGPRNNKVMNVAANWVGGPLHLGFGYEKNDGDKDSQFAVRGLYEMGALTLGAYYQRSDIAVIGTRDAYRVSAMYTAGASEFHANIGMADDWSNLANSDATQYTLGYNYNLSKRTKLYGFYTVVDNGSGYTYFGQGGKKASSLALGVRHNF